MLNKTLDTKSPPKKFRMIWIEEIYENTSVKVFKTRTFEAIGRVWPKAAGNIIFALGVLRA